VRRVVWTTGSTSGNVGNAMALSKMALCLLRRVSRGQSRSVTTGLFLGLDTWMLHSLLVRGRRGTLILYHALADEGGSD
jgi:hypothetical protein